MARETVTKYLHVNEMFGNANYTVWDIVLKDTDDGYLFLGEIEVPMVSEQELRDLALVEINKEIAKASVTLKDLQERKNQLLSITHEDSK